MDFHSLVRKDLQALCKLNKIPANRTNVAMAEALSSLQNVKGIETFCKSTESSVAESSVESPEKDVVTSPKTPRTGRRKQVREGSGVLQTTTRVAGRKNRLPVRNVQRVYNTRLSARLSNKELMEMENKECVEALKFSSYCDNDFGEVLEDKSVPGSDNIRDDSSVSQTEQQSESVKWNSADKDLDLKDTAVTDMKSKVLENNVEGFQIYTGEAVLEMPSHDYMAVVDLPIHQKKNDVGVTSCLYETGIVTEVLANEVEVFQVNTEKAVVDSPTIERTAIIPILSQQEKGSVDVGFSFSENEIQNESLKRRDCENLDAQVTASTVALNSKMDSSLSGIDMTTEVLTNEGSDNMDTAAAYLISDVPIDKVDGFQMVPQKPIEEMPSHGNKAVIDMPHHKMKDDVVGFSFSETDENVDAAVTPSTDRKEIKSLKEQLNMEGCEKVIYDDVGVDFCLSETDDLTEVVATEVKVFEMDADKAEMPTSDRKAAIPFLSPQEKGSDDVGFSYLENEVQSGTSKRENGENLDAPVTALTDMKAVDLNGKGRLIDCLAWSDDIVADASLSGIGVTALLTKKGSEDVGVHFSFSEADENVDADAAITRSTDSKESDSLKEQLRMESSEKVDYGEQVHDLMIEPNSENIVFESWSSAVKNVLDGDNLDISVKVQQDIGYNTESGAVYDNEKGLTSEEDFCGKVIASDPNIYSESYERTENSVHNSSGDDISTDAEFFQHIVYSKQLDNKRSVFETLSCNGAVEFADGKNLDISVEIQPDISCNTESGAVYDSEKGLTSQEEASGKSIASDPRIYSESYERIEYSIHNSSDDDFSADEDFIQHNDYSKQSDSKRKSVSEILSCNGTVEFADQLEMSGSIKTTNDFSGGLTFVNVSGDKDSLADDPESNFLKHVICSKQQERKRESLTSQILGSSGPKEPADQPENISSYQQLVASNEPSISISPSTLMCPSSAPPGLQARRTKSTHREPPLILEDYPFTKKFISSGVQSLGPCHFANTSNYAPTSKLLSNVSDDKENVEQNESKGELTKEKAYNSKNEVAVCKKYEVALLARSPTKMSR